MLRATFLKSALALVATTGLGLAAFAGGTGATAAKCCCGDNCKCEECGCVSSKCAKCGCDEGKCQNCGCTSCKYTGGACHKPAA
jgi:hypothetical protein